MILINLLPYRQKRREEKVQKIIIAWVSSLLLGVGAAFFVDGMMNDEIVVRETKVSDNKRAIDRLDQQLGEVAQLEERKALLNERIDVIGKLRQNSALSVKLLDEIIKSIPDPAWLIELKTNKDNKATIRGLAQANNDVASFLNNLKATDFFVEVDLDKIRKAQITNLMKQRRKGPAGEEETVDTLVLKDFTIEATMKAAEINEGKDGDKKRKR